MTRATARSSAMMAAKCSRTTGPLVGRMDLIDSHLEQLVSGVAEQGGGGRIHPAEAFRLQLGDEDRFACAFEDRRIAELGRVDRFLRPSLIRDVRDRPEHPHRLP